MEEFNRITDWFSSEKAKPIRLKGIVVALA
jgi:hypothetical protein